MTAPLYENREGAARARRENERGRSAGLLPRGKRASSRFGPTTLSIENLLERAHEIPASFLKLSNNSTIASVSRSQ